jgi:hypothetical protein
MFSYIPGGRNPETDYYRLQNREKQLDAINRLSAEEQEYVLGGVLADDQGGDARESIKNAIQKVHEEDLISLRALVHVNKLGDTDPYLVQLKAVTGLNTREEIAAAIAKRQVKRLMDSQIDAITSPQELRRVYATTIQRGGQAFASLW